MSFATQGTSHINLKKLYMYIFPRRNSSLGVVPRYMKDISRATYGSARYSCSFPSFPPSSSSSSCLSSLASHPSSWLSGLSSWSSHISSWSSHLWLSCLWLSCLWLSHLWLSHLSSLSSCLHLCSSSFAHPCRRLTHPLHCPPLPGPPSYSSLLAPPCCLHLLLSLSSLLSIWPSPLSSQVCRWVLLQ